MNGQEAFAALAALVAALALAALVLGVISYERPGTEFQCRPGETYTVEVCP